MRFINETCVIHLDGEHLKRGTEETELSESPPLAPSLGTRNSLRSRRLELVGARKNGARVSPSRATKEGFTKFRAILTRKRDCKQLQKFGEREQGSTHLNFASKSSKGKILRAVEKILMDHDQPFILRRNLIG